MIGEPVVFIPLAVKPAAVITGAELCEAFGPAACALAYPLTFPIRCEVDDYRQLSGWADTANTKVIEDVFGSVGQFLESCIQGEKIEATGRLGAGCFMHPQVYDRMVKPLTGGKHEGSVWAKPFAAVSDLERIGCTHRESLPGTRYSEIYALPQDVRVHFASDGAFTHLVIDGVNMRGDSLRDFQREMLLRGRPGFDADLIKLVKGESAIQSCVRQDVASANALAQTLKNAVNAPLFRRQGDYFHHLFRDCDTVYDRYWQEWEKDSLIVEVELLFNLLWNFSKANRVLLPSAVGGQYPEHSDTLLISNFVAAVAHDRAVKGCNPN